MLENANIDFKSLIELLFGYMKVKKDPNKITLILTDKELSMLSLLQGKEGQKSLTEVVHDSIREKFLTMFTHHGLERFPEGIAPRGKTPRLDDIILPEEALTNEQLCEKNAGKVLRGQEGGMQLCGWQFGEKWITVPITMKEKFEEMAIKYGSI